ncbi:large conductance mechanosensitive channel protein MscL [Arthrobacter sp. 35W]|uniref:large conductance mechanosensitive channel protein MscL n=1 Tax=Arthrobacter sp. 35W TaxID=1132441 RepID=UPI000402376C|nr:large conductance mechanosensitive channel protein MscL [Arthrobacter sp. 35W]
MLKGFKEFISHGNAIDLAVGVIIGAAFSAVVTALVEGIITPMIAAIFGKPDISHVGNFVLNGAEFSVGSVLQALLNFLLVAIALYFAIVLPINHMKARAAARRPVEEIVAEVDEQTVLLTEIRDALRRG